MSDNKKSTEKENDPKKEEQEVELPKDIKKSKISLIKKGDYSIHILVEEIKNALSKNSDQLPSPVIKMTAFGQTQRTAICKINCSDNIFNEHFYFDKTDLTVQQLDKEKILIEVYDYNNSSKADYLGVYEFDIEYIYNFPKHAMHNYWIALANPEAADITKINGYLRISISVLNDNDPRVELNPASATSNSDNCLIPSQIKLKYKQISIQIFKGEDLPDDSDINKLRNKKCNAYIETEYMGSKYKTNVVDMVNDVVDWNECFNLGLSLPAVSKKITFLVKDKDLLKTNLFGSFTLDVDDILNDKYKDFTYVHIYGSSSNNRNSYYDQMNSNSDLGSKWKGRILIKINVTDTDKPICEVQSIKDKALIQEAYENKRQNLWTLHFKLFNVLYLPEKNKKYSVRVSMQENLQTFPKKKSIIRALDYYIGNTLQCLTSTNNVEELPDIFIYLLNDDGDPICFQRLSAADYHLCNNIVVIKLIPEPCVGKVKNNTMCGLVKMKLMLVNKQIDGDNPLLKEINMKDFETGEGTNREENEDEDLESMLGQKSQKINNDDLAAIGLLQPKKTLAGGDINTYYSIIINVYMSRHLISGDSDGTSDPYVEISIEDTILKTSVKHNCINGIWNESLRFGQLFFDIKDQSTWPILYVKVMDKDSFSDDFLCYNYIWLSDMAYHYNDPSPILKPKWHQLFLSKSNKKQGQILLSAYIFDPTKESLGNEIEILPETINYSFEINVLGMRNLQPLSIIPVKKAYVSFDLNSINFNNSDENEIQPVKTEPKDSGSNPNITSIIKFNAKLPKDLTFIPNLQCEVCDYILNGIFKQNLGIFELNIVNIINETLAGIEKDSKISSVSVGNFLLNKQKLDIGSNQGLSAAQRDSNDKFIVDTERNNNLNAPLVENENEPGGDVLVEDDNKLENNYLVSNREDLSKYNLKKYNDEEINNNLFNSNYFILRPVFKQYSIPGIPHSSKDYHKYYIENENEAPDDANYFPLGYNKYTSVIGDNQEICVNEAINKKHYRRIFNTELENVKELNLASPFIKCTILRDKFEDKSNSKDQFYDNMSQKGTKILKVYNYDKNKKNYTTSQSEEEDIENDQYSQSKSYGEFKAIAKICQISTMKEYNEKINTIREREPYLLNSLKYYQKNETVSKRILTKTSVVIRVYILKLCDLAKKDTFSLSDPYIKISLGNKKDIINEKNNHINDASTCDWYKSYDIATELPGNGTLTISVYDYDPLFSDELIGETKIDVEDRFFDNEWLNLKFKPIERRNLYHPDFKNKQGDIILFLEIFNKNDRLMLEPWNIAPEPKSNLQVRLIVYETEDIACLDVEGTSDVYVIGYLDNDKHQSTDIHYRCQTGTASFNWRMIFDVEMPRDKYSLNLLVYDNDILAKDDFICANSLNINRLLKDCNILDVPIKFTKDYYADLAENEKGEVEFISDAENGDGNKFWVQMYKEGKKAGRVLCSLEILPMWKAQACPVGKGRDEPNVNPYLPPPVGRVKFSLNPFTMINQLVGPKFRKKIYASLLMCCCITYCIIVIPFVIYYVGGELVNPFNYIKRITKSSGK